MTTDNTKVRIIELVRDYGVSRTREFMAVDRDQNETIVSRHRDAGRAAWDAIGAEIDALIALANLVRVDPLAINHDPGDEDRRYDFYCENCGDPFDGAAELAAVGEPSPGWRQCPWPSLGLPMKDCGVGGHMYREDVRP